MSILDNIYNFYQNLENYADPRAKDFPLLGSVWPTIGLLAVYMYFVQNVGPKWMKNRKAFELKTVILVYDAIQVILNFLAAMLGAYSFIALYNTFNIRCAMPSLSDDSMRGYIELRLSYFYFLLKIVDLMDTVFFVLRKNFRLITFLHVYHHAVMVFISYFYCKYYPGGHSAMIGLVNLWIHVMMYGYYFVAALKPEVRNSLWWKKYITLFQMGQFVFLICFMSLPFFEENCNYSKTILVFNIIQSVVMLILFSNFYIRSYILRKKPKTT
ncbi:elongation of very long chain fatty acids protein 7-like [Condylostylus longicornis]|uniref:elongation of very long chain fatty acids protein 7-like n=1 Tax=Condylostylus longicornis TaxID=2530218 RepID=UPI00244DA920|nr:elongation of very long chain fatty acids protein 7-like [Condylostylus longicornis]